MVVEYSTQWVPVELYGANNDGQPVKYTIADGVSVSKGDVLQLLDARVASYSHLASVPVAGVAMEDHVANQGSTTIACYTQGIFEAYASGAIDLGSNLVMDKVKNHVKPVTVADIAASYGVTIGRVLEAATDAERVNVRLNL